MSDFPVPMLAIDVDSGPTVLTGHDDLLHGLGSRPISEDYDGEESRYAIYSVKPNYRALTDETIETRRRIAETSLGGIGLCLHTLRAEGDLSEDSRVGIFDRLHRSWLVNPWSRGDLR